MKKYILEVTTGQQNTAGTKAKEDITDILESESFARVSIKLKSSKLWKLFFLKKVVAKKMNAMKSGDVFVIQYPMYSEHTLKFILQECKRKSIKTVGIIHDIESLRMFRDDKHKISNELNIFNEMTVLITHNIRMSNWLESNHITSPLVPLEIFDYLNSYKNVNTDLNDSIVFAGNLEKAKFLEKWNGPKKIKLYGINPSSKYDEYINYKGAKSPDELPKFLSGSFGLIWDGDKLSTNSGIFGEYTKFNNPHKVSLYLSCGLPVIVWNQAAIADFVKKNNVGIIVRSIGEMQEKIDLMSEESYDAMHKNAKEMSKLVKKGFFIKRAITASLEEINRLNTRVI